MCLLLLLLLLHLTGLLWGMGSDFLSVLLMLTAAAVAATDRLHHGLSHLNETLPAPESISNGKGGWVHTLSRHWKPTKSDIDDIPDGRDGHCTWNNRTQSFVKAHLTHAIVDIVMSLLGFAVVINSLYVINSLKAVSALISGFSILIIASAVFFYRPDGSSDVPADLFQAHDLIKSRVGSGQFIESSHEVQESLCLIL